MQLQGRIEEDAWTHTRNPIRTGRYGGCRPRTRRAGCSTCPRRPARWYATPAAGSVPGTGSAPGALVYPLRGGGFDGQWANLVIGLSLLATLATVLGILVGLLRWRFRKPYRSGSRSPYAGGFSAGTTSPACSSARWC